MLHQHEALISKQIKSMVPFHVCLWPHYTFWERGNSQAGEAQSCFERSIKPYHHWWGLIKKCVCMFSSVDLLMSCTSGLILSDVGLVVVAKSAGGTFNYFNGNIILYVGIVYDRSVRFLANVLRCATKDLLGVSCLLSLFTGSLTFSFLFLSWFFFLRAN